MKRLLWTFALLLVGSLPLGAPTALAQVDPNQPVVVALTLSPAGEPTPALRYEFLPRTPERRPGNAATNYYRAVISLQQIPPDIAKDESKWFDEFGDDVYHKVPRERMERWVNAHQSAFDELRHGVYRESCDWGTRMQDLRGPATVEFLLHEFQQLRWIIRALNLRARMAIEREQFDASFDMLRMHYQSARDVASQPNIICGLIGIAFTHLANERVEQWIGTAGSPNLYWAFASLPHPLISMRDGLQQERAMPERLFPYLADAETVTRSPEEWQKLLVDTLNNLNRLGSDTGGSNSRLVSEAAVMALVGRGYPIAKRELLAAGFDRGRLEAMPVGQVVAIHMARTIRANYDAKFKGYLLPYPQALAWSAQEQKRHSNEPQLLSGWDANEIVPISPLLLPALDAVIRAEIRNERFLAALQTLEAIRLHQATTGGRFPASLDDITVVPLPLNPATQKPFPYRLEGEGAVLDVPTVPGEPGSAGRRYVLKSRGK